MNLILILESQVIPHRFQGVSIVYVLISVYDCIPLLSLLANSFPKVSERIPCPFREELCKELPHC